MQNTVLNVHPTISTYTSTTFDLQQQRYLKVKSDLQSQVADQNIDHPGDDALPEGKKSAKRQNTSRSSKSVRGSSSKQHAKESKQKQNISRI
ncbi:hypothetical protein Tco_1569460 [Tanacetum coccineum]